MLKQRLLTVLWTLPVVIAAVWYGEPWFTIVVATAGFIGVYEFSRMAALKASPLTPFALVWSTLFIVSPHLNSTATLPLLLTSAMIISLIWSLMRRRRDEAFLGWALTIAGILYIGWLLSYLVALRNVPDGRGWVFLALFTTFASDSAAYLVGTRWGKRRLAPFISPRKTWEGALAGAAAAMLMSPGVAITAALPLDVIPAILLGLAVSIAGQFGDLSLSLLKRSVGVKNAGGVLPGHGGLLDRLNSILFAAVLVYYIAVPGQWAA